MDEPFVAGIVLATTLPCLADTSKCVAVGRLSRPLTPVLPYANAILPNVISYSPEVGVMTLRRKRGFITVYPDKVFITQVNDAADGQTMLDALAELFNTIWARRAQIVPASKARSRPGMLDVWKLLPRTNCKRCGLPTCMALAVGLLLGTSALADCRPLIEERMSGQRAALRGLLGVEDSNADHA